MGKPAMPVPPVHLADEALVEWYRLGPALHANGTLDSQSVALVASYCSTWAVYVEAGRQLREHGSIRRALSTGRPSVSIYYRVWLRTSRDLLQAATTLGLSPASRTR